MTAAQQNTADRADPPRLLRLYPLATHRMRRTDYFPTHYQGALWLTV
jgi:hypothetical protein